MVSVSYRLAVIEFVFVGYVQAAVVCFLAKSAYFEK
jgi:hypothetical protein